VSDGDVRCVDEVLLQGHRTLERLLTALEAPGSASSPVLGDLAREVVRQERGFDEVVRPVLTSRGVSGDTAREGLVQLHHDLDVLAGAGPDVEEALRRLPGSLARYGDALGADVVPVLRDLPADDRARLGADFVEASGASVLASDPAGPRRARP
jgi:hypothetical protein